MMKINKPEKEQGKEKGIHSDIASVAGQASIAPLSVQDIEIVEYIAEMLIPLRHLAINANTEFLSYLIEMAIEEAHLQTEKKN